MITRQTPLDISNLRLWKMIARTRFERRLIDIRGDGTDIYVAMVITAVFVLFEGRTGFFKPKLRAGELDDFFSLADVLAQPT